MADGKTMEHEQTGNGPEATKGQSAPQTHAGVASRPAAMAPGGRAALVLTMQRAAGNRATAATIQRWTNPVITLKSRDELIQDGAGGDINAINQLSAGDYGHATEPQRLAMIGHINARGNDRWGRDTTSLCQLWDSFGDDLPRVTMVDNLARWRASAAQDMTLMASVRYTKRMRDAFPADVRATVVEFLRVNEEFATTQMQALGLPAGGGAATLPAPDAAQTAHMNEVTTAAASLAKVQRAQEETRSRAYVGYALQTPSIGPMVPGGPGPALGNTWLPVTFDPTAAPVYRQAPAGILDNVVSAPTPLQPYEQVKEKYDAATASVQTLMGRYPELAIVARSGTSAATADFATKDPAAARAELARNFDGLFADIRRTRTMIAPGGDLDPLDLAPVHAQMTGGFRAASVEHDWSTPLANSIVTTLAADHAFNQALARLGMHLAAQALFMFAPLAGEAALVLMFAGLAVEGIQAQMSEDRFHALQTAARTAPAPGTQLVAPGAVDAAGAINDADQAALALAIFAVGTAVAAELIGGLTSRFANTRAWRSATEARNARVDAWRGLSKSQRERVATVTGGTNVETGQTVSGVNQSGLCAEDNVAAQLGGDPSKIRFSPAIRPRTGNEVPVCTRCQGKFNRSQFPPGTRFD